MAMFSRRPASLAHVSDEQAARALSRRFGAIVEAARDLGVDRRHLRRLTWSNPAILDAAHERMSFFAFARRNEVMAGLMSSLSRVRRRAVDRMFANPWLFGDLDHPLAPAPRRRRDPSEEARGRLARERLERQAADELARERAMEIEREREAAETVVAIKPSLAPQVQGGRPWPAGIRRPTRGRRWR